MSCSCLSFLKSIFCCECNQAPNQANPKPQASAPEVQKQAAKVERVSSVSMPTSDVLQIFNNRDSGIHIEMINPQIFIHQEFVSASSSSASSGQARSSTMRIKKQDQAAQQVPMTERPMRQEVQKAAQATAVFSPGIVDPSHKIQASIGRARSSTMQIAPLSEAEKQQDEAAQNSVIKEDDGRSIPIILMTEIPVQQVVQKAAQATAIFSPVKVDSSQTQKPQELAPSASSSSQSNGVASSSKAASRPAKPSRNPNLHLHRAPDGIEIMKKNKKAHHNRVRSKSVPARKAVESANAAVREERPYTPYLPRIVVRELDEQGKMITHTKYLIREGTNTRFTQYASVARVYAEAMAPIIQGENNAAAEDSSKKS